MRNDYIKILSLSFLAVIFCACSSADRKVYREQLREMQKDSTVNASFFGIALGDQIDNALCKLDSLTKIGKVLDYSLDESPVYEGIDDAREIIGAFPFSRVVKFNSSLMLKQLEGYNEVEITTYLGFRSDSLYAVIVFPNRGWGDLETNKVIGTYSEKYGGLYYIDTLATKVNPRRHFDGEGWMANQVKETTSYSATSTVWRYKDAEIFLVDKIENTIVYTFNQDDFNRELRNMPYEYRDDVNSQCRRMIGRLDSNQKKENNFRTFIAYKNLNIHKKDFTIMEMDLEAFREIEIEKKAHNDSLKYIEQKKEYLNQDI